MPSAVARARIADRDRLALEAYLAAVDRVDAREALDQRGLAGAVVTDEGRDLSRVDVEVDVVQDVDGAEALVELRDLKDRFGHTDHLCAFVTVLRTGSAGGRVVPGRPTGIVALGRPAS